MTNEEIKKIVCEIINMNGGEFTYSPSATFYIDGSVIISCSVRDKVTMNFDVVQASSNAILQRVHDKTQSMLVQRERYKKERREQLLKEWEALS